MSELDISATTEPKSDQQNFDDYVSGPKTVTVAEVKKGSAEQPVEIHLVEFPGRPYKPAKSMRRVLIAAWGKDASQYAGRRITLYGDPTVKFGGKEVGGIRISHLSHIPGPLEVKLTVTRGKRDPFTVLPLDAPVEDFEALLVDAETIEALQEVWARVVKAGRGRDARLVEVKDEMKAQLTEADR